MVEGNGRAPIRSYEDIEAFKRSMVWLRPVHEIVLSEVVVHLQIAEALGYLTTDQTTPLVDEYRIIGKQLTKLIEVWK